MGKPLTGNIVTKQPCEECGGTKYYRAKNLCVGCYMAKVNGEKNKAQPDVKLDNFKKKMKGVRYD